MCISCGGMWPWGHAVHLAEAPTKDEYIFLDQNHSFYKDHRTGYHPPAPVYQSSQPAMPQYYYNPTAAAQTPIYMNGAYYTQPQAPAPGWPYSSSYYQAPTSSYACHPYIQSTQPQVTCSNYYTSLMDTAYPSYPYATGAYGNWGTLLQASAAAAAANAALSQQPKAPAYFVGATKADIAFQNNLIAQNTGANMPSQLAPYKPAAGQQFWCKETDGSWTLRSHAEVTMGEIAPGHWEKHATSGYFYWVRQ